MVVEDTEAVMNPYRGKHKWLPAEPIPYKELPRPSVPLVERLVDFSKSPEPDKPASASFGDMSQIKDKVWLRAREDRIRAHCQRVQEGKR